MPDQPPGLDAEKLYAHLERTHPGLAAGPLTARVIAGGKSNLTYLVTDGTARWVLRRPPLGHVLATAHDMAREFRVISALAGTAVPVPAALLLCEDPAVLGTPFYLMEEVRGTVYRTAQDTAGLGTERARALAEDLIDVLAELHAVDPAQVGLSGFGRPEGFMARQVDRWRRQLEASRSREIEGMDELYGRLRRSVPTGQRATVVHGDYRLDNAIVVDDRVAAVLDWEMAAIGDPLSDLGLMRVYWEIARDMPDNPVASAISSEAGFPPMEELIARYSERSGLDVTLLPWYTAFARYKLAIIAEGIHYRFTQGKTVGDGFSHLGAVAQPLVAAALHSLLAEGS